MSRTRHFIHIKRLNLLYGRVPKVANSSIKAALCKLLEQKPSKGIKTTSDRFWREYTHDETELLSPNQARKLRQTHESFSFVRNPFDRLIAAYNNKVLEIEMPPLPMRRMGVQHQMPFDAFLQVIAETPAENLDVHLMPQSLLLCAGSQLVPKFIGRMEEMAAHWLILRKRLNKRGIRIRKELPEKNVRRSSKISLQPFFKNPSIVDRFMDVYGRDVELFYPEVAIKDLINNQPLAYQKPLKSSAIKLLTPEEQP